MTTTAKARFTKSSFEMTMEDRRKQTTDCHISADCPGLAIHKVTWPSGNGHNWSVSHMPSGYVVINDFTTMRAAKAFAVAVAHLTDWTQPRSKLSTKRIGKDIRRIYSDVIAGRKSEPKTAAAKAPVDIDPSKIQTTSADYHDANENHGGWCLACKAQASGVEPDAENYRCDECGEFKVFGAEQLLVMDKIELTDIDN